jgi:hypothetical protein
LKAELCVLLLPLVKRHKGFKPTLCFTAFSFTRCRRVAGKKSPPSWPHGPESFSQIKLTAPFHTTSYLPLTPPSCSPSHRLSRPCHHLSMPHSPHPTPPRATTSRCSSLPLPAIGSPLIGGGGAPCHRHRRDQEALPLDARRCFPCAQGGGQGCQDGGIVSASRGNGEPLHCRHCPRGAEVFCGLQSAHKESRSVSASVLEDQVHQIHRASRVRQHPAIATHEDLFSTRPLRFLKSLLATPQSSLGPGKKHWLPILHAETEPRAPPLHRPLRPWPTTSSRRLLRLPFLLSSPAKDIQRHSQGTTTRCSCL